MKTQIEVEESSLTQLSPEQKKKRARARTAAVPKRNPKARTAAKTAAGKKIQIEEAYTPPEDGTKAVTTCDHTMSPEPMIAVAEQPAAASAPIQTLAVEAIEFSQMPVEEPSWNDNAAASVGNLEDASSETVAVASQASSEIQGVPEVAPLPASDDPALVFQRNRLLFVVTSFWNLLMSRLSVVWNWTLQKLKSQQGKKRLRVCESVSLGEKRFLAVIQVDGEQFLVGGSSSSVATLARLEAPREFSSVFQQHCEQDFSRA